MREYVVEVTSVTTLYVEADNEDEAIVKAYEKAWYTAPDINNAVIVSVTSEDN